MLKIDKLTVNHLTEAIGMDEAPRFAWKIIADFRGFVQQKYRLMIAQNVDFCAPVYDSGWVETEQSLNVECAGFEMRAAREYFARVAVAGIHGEESDWSAPLRFVSGMMDMPWQAKYVSAENPPCPEDSKGTCVAGKFTVDGAVQEAWLFTSAKGVYAPYMNGSRVAGDLLAPGWTSYHKHALYQTNDVKSYLRQGENAIGAMLGAGWYKGLMGFLSKRNNYGDQTAFLCQLLIRYADGREQIVVSDESWIGGDSPVIFSEIYDGEKYDARMERDGWCTSECMPKDWDNVAIVDGDFSVLNAQPGCRIRCRMKLPASALIITPEGDRVVDFGQNLSGWPEFAVRGAAGESYTLKCFETLDAKGNVYTANLRLAKQELHYTCKGSAEEKHHPEFTFYGFRYIHLVNWPQNAKAEDFCAWVVSSDMEDTGEFECSEPLVNQLHRNIRWSQIDNFLDVPTDCPQRNERVGWTGDAQIFCRTASSLMDVYAFYRKWLKDVQADQQPDGGVSHIVPDIISGQPEAANDWLLSQGAHSAAGWADAIVICPWTLYLVYGDKQILEEQYESMRKWISFMRDHAVDYIWNYKLQFGDWVALDAEEGSYFGATPNDLTCTAYYAYSTQLFAKIASILGKDEDAKAYGELYNAIVDKFRRTFFNSDGSMNVQTQTAHILALHFDLAAPEHREKTAQALVRLLDREDGHLVTGFMGTTFFTHALANNGYADRAYDLLLKEDFPSWLYQIKAGATTVWEHWDGIRPDGSMWSPDMNSFNHYAYGSIGEWLYRGIAGIDADPADPAYHHAILHPKINRRMQYARASIETPYGKLSLGWKIDGEGAEVSLCIPANTHATLLLQDFTEVQEADGIAFVMNGEGLQAELPSGEYRFRCR